MTAPVLEQLAPTATPAAPAAVRTRGLTKRFPGGQVAVDGLDMVVPRGSVTGFLGPNGSGKTTTIRMLLGLVTPTSGSVELLGEPVPRAAASVLPRVGALVEGPAFHPYLTGRSNLVRLDAADRTVAPGSSRERIDAALDRVGLSGAATKRFRTYSLGMKQRLGLAAAMLRPRELFVLDEPTNGLDPQGTREVRTLVRELAADGCTVLVSSHLLAEIEQMCDRVLVMRTGRVVAAGTLSELSLLARPSVVVDSPDREAAAGVLRRLGAGAVVLDADGTSVRAELPSVAVEDVTRALVHAGVPVRGIGRQGRSLEDLFVELTGEGFDVV